MHYYTDYTQSEEPIIYLQLLIISLLIFKKTVPLISFLVLGLHGFCIGVLPSWTLLPCSVNSAAQMQTYRSVVGDFRLGVLWIVDHKSGNLMKVKIKLSCLVHDSKILKLN